MGPPAKATVADPEASRQIAWCGRGLRAGFAAGLVTALLARGAQAALGPGFEAEVGLAAHVAGSLWTATLFALAGLLSALATSPLVRSSRGRLAAAGMCAFLLSALATHHALLAGVRIIAGTFPTLAALEMFWNSPSQFFHAARVGHGREISLLLGGGAASTVMLGWALARPHTGGVPSPRVLLATGAAASAIVALFATAPATTPLFRGILLSTPELSLLSRSAPSSSAPAHEMVASGPPLEAARSWAEAAARFAGPRPNVLLLVLESVPPDHLGSGGYGRPVSPHLDALAARSVRYIRAWATSTQSNYAQMALLSSLFPRRRESLDWHDRLDYPRILFHDVFHQLGYKTATISSQNENWQGMRRFQNTGTPTVFKDSNDHPGPHIGSGEERKLPDHLTTDVLLGWLAEQDGPWAVYVNFQRTHFPYQLPAGFVGPWQPSEPDPARFGYLAWPLAERQTVINRYDNALRYVDEQVGRIARWLDQRGALQSTLWIITSDHGEAFGEHGVVTHGKTVHETQARVPLFFHWPARLPPKEVDAPVSHLDVLPTLLDLLGLPPHPAFQGRSFADAERHRAANTAVLISLQGLRAVDGVVCWPWKLTLDYTARTVALRDLANDPREEVNLFAPEHPVAAQLTALLLAQMEAQVQYHAPRDRTRQERFAPRLPACPALPAPGNVAAR